PMALVGFDPLILLSVSGFNLLYQFWIHTESIKKLPKWFEAVFNTPSHHRVHHARNPKYIDKNHGGTFIVWDRLFGTFKEEEERPLYGITKNLNSWNPVWANISHYSDMWKDIKTIPSLGDKVKYIFNKPGWLPESLGGYRAPYDVDLKTYKKFDLSAAKAVNIYVFVQYVLLLGGTALFLFNLKAFENNLLQKTVLALIIILSTVNFGAMFEAKSWAIFLEFLRLLSIPVVLWIFFPTLATKMIVFIGIAIYSMASIIWIMTLRKSIISPIKISS
ncbi:MAG TPA: sterol desaturase family protein, partial [Roseivirga sp.]